MKLGTKPCMRVYRILNKTVSDCEETCLFVKKIYRFGNHFISFRNALGIALGTGMKTIRVSKDFLFLSKNFNYEKISIEINEDQTKCISNAFFYLPGNNVVPVQKQIQDLNSKFKSMYLNLFPKVHVADNALVIHMRSGDVFYRRVHRLYGQPPCSYYKDVIDMKKWSNIFLISQDRRNPCVNVIEKYTERFKRQTMKLDMAYLLNAKNLVVSHSTLTNAIPLLSKNLKNVYIYNQSRFLNVNSFNCIAHEDYFNSVLKDWQNNKSQRYLMLNSHSCIRWDFYPKMKIV